MSGKDLIGIHQAHELIAALEKAGLTSVSAQQIITSKGNDLARKMITAVNSVVMAIFSIIVDYTMSLEAMIKVGAYDYENNEITAERFPLAGKGRIDVDSIVEHFGKYISTDAALKALDKKGLRPATIAELLAFGAKYPEEQRKYPIVALGSVGVDSIGYRVVACLYELDSKRRLNLRCVGDDWSGDWRFLAVSK